MEHEFVIDCNSYETPVIVHVGCSEGNIKYSSVKFQNIIYKEPTWTQRMGGRCGGCRKDIPRHISIQITLLNNLDPWDPF